MVLCLTDSDVVVKLAELDALDEIVKKLGCKYGDVAVHPAELRRLEKKVGTKLTSDGFARVKVFIGKVRTIGRLSPEAQVIHRRLNGNSCIVGEEVLAIDPGEALLYAAAADFGSSRFLTGDKRAMRCLCALGDCTDVAARLAGRIICFEQLLKLLFSDESFELMRERALKSGCEDKVMKRALEGSKTHCHRVLDEEIERMRLQTGGLLCSDPLTWRN
jgi:hypothetical protein